MPPRVRPRGTGRLLYGNWSNSFKLSFFISVGNLRTKKRNLKEWLQFPYKSLSLSANPEAITLKALAKGRHAASGLAERHRHRKAPSRYITFVTCRFRVQGSGCRVQGAGFRVWGLSYRVEGSGCKDQGFRFRAEGSGIRIRG